MNCPKCGEYNPDGTLVCGNCRCSISEDNRAKSGSSYYTDGETYYAVERYSEALKCFLKAAELGYTGAYIEIGDMYYYGRGTAVNYSEAARWYQKAVDEADCEAYKKIAVMYHYGRGVDKDIRKAIGFYNEAIEYYKVGIEMQFARAAEELGSLYESAPEGIRSYNLAMLYYEKAAELGSTKAMIYEKLGLAYGEGIGRPVSKKKAFQFYKKAVEYGCNDGKVFLNLAQLYHYGKGGEENLYLARDYYKKAIDLGYTNAESEYREAVEAIKKKDAEIKASVARLQAYNAQFEINEKEEWQRRLTRICPRCGRNSGHPINETRKKASIAFWGYASNKWGKSYQCSSCDFMW